METVFMKAKKSKSVAKAAKVVPSRKGRVTPGTKPLSTAAFIRDCIRKVKAKKSKMTDEQILAAARKRPEAKGQNISAYYVNWYRWQMDNRPTKRAA
jgi:hypothetical protein